MKKDDGRRDSAASEAPAEGASLAAVSSLMDERRRFEGWIASLEARRGATAPHVFERVHADYTTRLGAVLEKLTTHAEGLRSELAALSLRLEGLRDEQKRAEDERSEGELRAHVGELSASDWERMASSSDARLAELGQKYGAVEQELGRTRELLDAAERPAGAPAVQAEVAAAPAAAAPVSPPPPPAPVPAAEAPATRKSVPVAARPVTPPVTEVEVERKPTARASATMFQPVEPPAAEQQSLGIEESVATATPPAAAAPAAAAPPAAPVVSPPASASPSVRPGVDLTPSSSPRLSKFDELAFLSSVVDTPSGGVIDPAPADEPDEKTRRETFAMRAQEEEIENLSSRRSTPLDNAVTEYEREESSALGVRDGTTARTSTGADGAKTLKCSECASMNYPTEWYCERCGAELASL